MRTLILSTATAVLLAGTAAAAANAAMSDWDRDHDGAIERNEFNSAMANDRTFANCDADGNGTLTQGEFNDCMFTMFGDKGQDTWNQNNLQTWLDRSVRSGADVRR